MTGNQSPERQQLLLAEYSEATSLYSYTAEHRFKRLTMIGTLNAALIAILRFSDSPSSNVIYFVAAIAIIVTAMLFLFERRASEHRQAYKKRIREIEGKLGFSLYTHQDVPTKKTFPRNAHIVAGIYLVVILSWAGIAGFQLFGSKKAINVNSPPGIQKSNSPNETK